ncbi:MAG TPA: PAS domain-containing protein [Vicinamibacterales bacterium]|nr:PAS domain-containing protein [Vicinamibacterales bacterium]
MTAFAAASWAAIAVVVASLPALIRIGYFQRRRTQRAELVLEQNDRWYRGILDTQSELICRFRPDTTLTFVNEACCRFWRRERPQLLGERLLAVVPEAMRLSLWEQIEATLQSQQIGTRQYQVMLLNDTLGWLEWTHHPIADAGGSIVEIQAVGRDITDQRRAERVQRTVESKAQAILRAGPDLMFVLSPDGIFLDYYAARPEHLYAPPDRFLGRSIGDIMPPDLAARFMDALARARSAAEPVVVEYTLSIGGDDRHYETRLVSDERGHIVCVVRDITDHRRAELALGHSEAVLRMVRDRNKDLAGRLIASQEVERRRLARELHDDLSQKLALLAIRVDQLEHTQAMSDAMAVAVREISQQTRDVASDIHRVSHQLHPFKLEALGLVASLEAACAEMWQQYGVSVDFTHHDVPPDLHADVALCVYRIAQESLHNVAKHSGAAHAAVWLSRDNDELELQIIDRGAGFLLATGERNGLGLVSIRERASFAGGRVAIHSKPGAGTAVSLRVPIGLKREIAVSDSDRRSA